MLKCRNGWLVCAQRMRNIHAWLDEIRFILFFFRGCIQICYADTLDTHTVILKWSALPFWCCRQFVGQMKLIRQLNIRYQHWLRWEKKRSQIKRTLPFPWENRNQRGTKWIVLNTWYLHYFIAHRDISVKFVIFSTFDVWKCKWIVSKVSQILFANFTTKSEIKKNTTIKLVLFRHVKVIML